MGVGRGLIITYPLLESHKTTQLSLHPSAPPSACQPLNFETLSLLQENEIFNDENYVKVRISWCLVFNSELIIL